MRGMRIAAAAGSVLLLAGGAAPPVAVGADDGAKALFEARCSICHGLDRPLEKTLDRQGWTETVRRMQHVMGCPVTDDEALEIVDYLVRIRGKGPSGP